MFRPASGTEDIDLFFVAYKLFAQFLRTQKGDVTASTCRTLSLYFISLLRHFLLLQKVVSLKAMTGLPKLSNA